MEEKSDQTIELETEVILRLPSEAAATLREIINNDSKEQLSIKLENDIRRGEVVIGDHHLFAKVVDLPTIIEGQKTIDNKTLYKTADICQMIICKENEEFFLSDEDEVTKMCKKKEPNKVDKKYFWPHGVTPPLKNVRNRRFRRILRKQNAEAPDIEKEVKYLLKSDSEAISVKWEVVSETEVQNNRKIKEEPFMRGELYNDLNQDIAETDIFGEALSDSDEDGGNINIMDIDEDMSNDNSRFSYTNSLMEEKPSTSGTQTLITEFSKEMFISDDNSHHGIKKEDEIDSTFDGSIGYRYDLGVDFKTELELSNDSELGDIPVLSTLKAGNVSADDIKHKICQLQQEIEDLKKRKSQQDWEIANIENINLRERFIGLSNNLLTEQLEKEQQRETLYQVIFRRKKEDDIEVDRSDKKKLARVLNLVDLTALGVGSTLGVGVYVLPGNVARIEAGPAVVLSFVLAALASIVAGLCYAEFAARVPRAGSAYVYSYFGVGEVVAYIIGWNLILEYVIGTASVAKALSNYIDALLDYPIRNTMSSLFPMDVSFLAEYPDVLSFCLVLLLSVILSWGVRESTMINNVFTVVNLFTVVIVVVSGLFKVNVYNWSVPKQDIPMNAKGGEGGFMPFGWAGVTAGAAKCFYGFIGFDSIATTGEEAKNPKRDIPLAIILSLIIITFAYCCISSVLTLLWPYYDQDIDAPFPYVYDQLGWITLKMIVSSGAIFAMFASLLASMFSIPRILMTMAEDGLMFSMFSIIHPKLKTPLFATLLSGLFAGIITALLNLEQLMNMMSIGTLLAYTIVCICVLILRYRNDLDGSECVENHANDEPETSGFVLMVEKYCNLSNIDNSNKDTERVATTITVLYICVSALFSFVTIQQECDVIIYPWCDESDSNVTAFQSGCVVNTYNATTPFEQPCVADSITTYTSTILASGLLLLLLLLSRQPQSKKKLSFKVPLVPLIPCISILMNVYLMLKLDKVTWIRFSIWLVIGLFIYALYGMNNSVEGLKQKGKPKRSSPRSAEPIHELYTSYL
ncbi:hypothetical protein ACI65C_006375 [Semiaphis heraclei]